ncbi:hypothetical protein LP52_17255 [Streptomonospora alba]|uniref:Chaplin domain-containing protein n=2 Tax=Streptomonospora alba TaxID=183763 RepID=A0A0C2JFZ1_9ACTN|nr:hypothetical protein [Streptomonospora alba]KIH97795.1 hypothetical protein LP52_17255 [Streptomonospora alba]
MMKKLTAAGLLAGAAMGAVLMAGPAHAGGPYGGDQQFNQNLQVVPVQLCNTNASVLGVTVPVLSPQTTGDCTNGPSSANVD